MEDHLRVKIYELKFIYTSIEIGLKIYSNQGSEF